MTAEVAIALEINELRTKLMGVLNATTSEGSGLKVDIAVCALHSITLQLVADADAVGLGVAVTDALGLAERMNVERINRQQAERVAALAITSSGAKLN